MGRQHDTAACSCATLGLTIVLIATPAADAVMQALGRVLTSGVRTRDLGGTATTREFADAVCRELSASVL